MDESEPPRIFNVRIEGRPSGFGAPADLPLLIAAHRAGIALPSSCRTGTCRTCICRLLSGEVRYRIEWPGLLPEEKAEGWILPCVAYPVSDIAMTCPGQ